MWLVVGLGNPGSEYAAHRHNIGFMVIDELRRRWSAPAARHKFGSEISETEYRGEKVCLQKPMEFMNLSGHAVQRALAFYKIELAHTLVVHDEIDLPLGKLRVKAGGGHGGHNGLRSISQMVGPDYLRVRCGVGRPPTTDKDRVADYVLSTFSKAERAAIPSLIGEAADAVEDALEHGAAHAMNRFNRDTRPEPAT